MDPINLHNSDIPPGLSLTVTLNLTNRPSAANPLSRHLPKIVVSMFPPLKIKTILKENSNRGYYIIFQYQFDLIDLKQETIVLLDLFHSVILQQSLNSTMAHIENKQNLYFTMKQK